MKKCYEIKKCAFHGTKHEDSKCPPYRLQMNCYEYDWVDFYNNIPECDEKYKWRDIMLNHCYECQVYEHNQNIMDIILENLKKA